MSNIETDLAVCFVVLLCILPTKETEINKQFFMFEGKSATESLLIYKYEQWDEEIFILYMCVGDSYSHCSNTNL